MKQGFFANYNLSDGEPSKPDVLPSEALEGALCRGNEYAWTPESFLIALERAEARGPACLGRQFQFRLNDATCEMVSTPAPCQKRVMFLGMLGWLTRT